ncbi:MAG: hypothetical protein KZQ76_01800 [Candidatus Thiodiazotropha sp. (ex Epidulcina cf. delphinae)]|nr:hypothetical protein [Candidatus Thiodiazotropha sp. (ex Epidulcina cf. delphinae)]
MTRMCDLMAVSLRAYYDGLKGPESARSLEDMRLSEKVKESHEKSRGAYGARRILKDLVDDNKFQPWPPCRAESAGSRIHGGVAGYRVCG